MAGSVVISFCSVVTAILLFNSQFLLAVTDDDVDSESCESTQSECSDDLERPTLSDLYKYEYFPWDAKRSTVRTIHRIGADYYHFGRCILDDKDGDWIEAIQLFKHYHPESIVSHTLHLWLQGKGKRPETWDTLLTCLRDTHLHRLADDIEIALGRQPSIQESQDHVDQHPNGDSRGSESVLSDPLLVDKKEFHYILGLLSSLQEVTSEIVDYTEAGVIGNCSKRLEKIDARLKSGRIRAGVVGITKAGKSTMLNALLGKSFLPSSVQPQTANEVSIIHNPSTPDGELLAVKEEGNEPEVLAVGRERIYQKLEELNSVKRANARSYHKLILQAPLVFLNKVGNIPLEISDTPGLGEAGGSHVTADSKIAVKDMCAFILIVNVQYLKTEVESELLSDLSMFHPELFSKLKRVLILVNAYDITYGDDNSISVKAPDIPAFVSKYLREPLVLGKNIPTSRIIPVSAKWALKSREWLANVSHVVDSKKTQTDYQQGVILLKRAGYKGGIESLAIREKPNKKTAMMVLQNLQNVSHIGLVESKLTEMLYKNSRAVMLESAIDDSLYVIEEIQDELALLVKREEVDRKERCRDFWEKIYQAYNATYKKYTREFSLLESYVQKAFRTQMSAIIDSLQDSLNSLVNSKLIEGLRDTNENDDMEYLLTRMRNVRSGIPSLVVNKMKVQWTQATDALQRAVVEQLKSILTEYRNEMSTTLNENVRHSCNSNGSMQTVFNQITAKLSTDAFNAAGLVIASGDLATDSLSYEKTQGSEALSDERLGSHVAHSTTTKFRTRQDKKCFGKRYWIAGPEDCIDYTVATPYDVNIYSADFGSLQNAFQGVVQSWISEFQGQVKTQLKRTSENTAARASQKISTALSDSEKELVNLFNLSNAALQRSKDKIQFVKSKLPEIVAVKDSLVSFLYDDGSY